MKNSWILGLFVCVGLFLVGCQITGKASYGTNDTNTNDTNCTSTTCSSLGKNCGTWDDGCGGSLNCGTCGAGYYCQNGICIQNQTTCTNECGPSGEKRCSGNYVQTCGNYDSDACLEWNTGTYCSYGCLNGACKSAPVNETCKDPDGRYGYYNKTTATGANGAKTDYCSGAYLSGAYLYEAYCSGSNTYFAGVTCPSGYTCSNGACVRPTPCTDSDGGFNYYVAGYVSYNNKVYYDVCKNTRYLNEYYCQSIRGIRSANVRVMLCSYGCQNNVCLKAPAPTNQTGNQTNQTG